MDKLRQIKISKWLVRAFHSMARLISPGETKSLKIEPFPHCSVYIEPWQSSEDATEHWDVSTNPHDDWSMQLYI